MSHTPQFCAREVISLLSADGWEYDRCSGSHKQFRHPEKPGIVTVAEHGGKPMPGGTLKSILLAAGLEDVFRSIKQGATLKQAEKTLRLRHG